jgi:glutaredoxin
MSFLINFIRNVLGSIIVFFDLISRPRKLQRTSEEQTKVESELGNLSLYQFYSCPFCIKTRRALHKLNLPIEKRNVSRGSPYRQELIDQGGKVQAPCLRIEKEGEVQWMYESSDIINYLEQRFS